VDVLLACLATVSVGLAFVLAGLAIFAARRFSETRFVYVGVALLALGGIGALGLLDLAEAGAVPGAGLEYPTVLLLLVAEGLLYLSMVTTRRRSGRPADG
jgi:hypothetical protein